MRKNETMKMVEKMMVLGYSFEEAVEIVVSSRPCPKEDHIVISRPDWSNAPGRCIRRD